MRVYALLLGVVLTSGYAYAAHVAVSSAAPGRSPAVVPASDANGPVWYGGVLDPIVVVAPRGGEPQTATTKDRVVSRPTFRCVGTDRSSVRTIS